MGFRQTEASDCAPGNLSSKGTRLPWSRSHRFSPCWPRSRIRGGLKASCTAYRTSCCSPLWRLSLGRIHTGPSTRSSMSIWPGCARPSTCRGDALRLTRQSEGSSSRWKRTRLSRSSVSVASENGSEELRIAPVCRARSLEQARERRPARLSAQAALLELLAAAAGAGIVPPHILERVNKRQRRVGIGQTGIPRTGGPPLLIPLGRIREGVPARELTNRILQRPDLVVLKARHALGIGQSSPQIPAKVIVAQHHGFDQTTPECLADNTGQRLKADQPDGQHPAAPHKALLLRLQRVIEPEQVGFCLFARDASGGRQVGQHL